MNVNRKEGYYVYDTVHLRRIVDADTLDLTTIVDCGFRHKTTDENRFRLRNYDAPENNGKTKAERLHAVEANKYAIELLTTGIRECHTYKMGVYDRWMADIILADGRNYAAVMIAAGFQKLPSYPPDEPQQTI